MLLLPEPASQQWKKNVNGKRARTGKCLGGKGQNSVQNRVDIIDSNLFLNLCIVFSCSVPLTSDLCQELYKVTNYTWNWEAIACGLDTVCKSKAVP